VRCAARVMVALLPGAAGMANAAELLIDGVPIPHDANIAAAPPDASDAAKRFLGAWVGSWGDLIKAVLIIAEVRADGTAKVSQAIGDFPPWNLKANAARRDATISGDALTLSRNDFVSTYRLAPDDTIAATYRGGQVSATARLTRYPLDDLKQSGAPIKW